MTPNTVINIANVNRTNHRTLEIVLSVSLAYNMLKRWQFMKCQGFYIWRKIIQGFFKKRCMILTCVSPATVAWSRHHLRVLANCVDLVFVNFSLDSDVFESILDIIFVMRCDIVKDFLVIRLIHNNKRTLMHLFKGRRMGKQYELVLLHLVVYLFVFNYC